MTAPGQSFQTNGFQTSVDIARRQTYSTVSLAGAGRFYLKPAQEYHGFTSGIISNNDSVKQRPVDFVAASSVIQKNRITASKISLAEPPGQTPSLFNDLNSPHPQVVRSAPAASRNPLLSLQNPTYGLPPILVANFASLGITTIYPWQAACLLGRGNLTGEKNLLYTAPTGGGKSLVADVLMLKKVIENPRRKAMMVFPYVALVQEKLKWLRRVVQGVEKDVLKGDSHDPTISTLAWRRSKQPSKEIHVTGFFGGSKSRTTWADTDIAVCTIEKANALINSAIEECNINDLGIIVLDEIHMLDDDSRGHLLEMIITKLLLLQQQTQIVAMSATLSNAEQLAQWLDASYYLSNHRPVPIEEHLVYENAIYLASKSREFFQMASRLNPVLPGEHTIAHRVIETSSFKELANPLVNAMVALAIETATAGYGALVFCSSRQTCQMNALLISEAMPEPSNLEPDILDRRLDLLADLQSLPTGLDPYFRTTIIKGVAFHHAGLTTEERELVVDAYDRGVLKVIVATCSLAAGINLPARRVIMQGARMGRDMVGPALLRQMRGRAGRKGKDNVGETYLICRKADLEAISELLEAETPAIESCLSPEKRGIKRALLEAIATRLVSGREAIKEYTRCTLLYRTLDRSQIDGLISSTLLELLDQELVHLRDDECYEATKLGQAIVASSFSPEDGIFVHDELKRALQAFVMDGEMHIFYMFTPLQVALTTNIDWQIFRDQLDTLDESGLRALLFVGVNPGFVNSMSMSGALLKETSPAQTKQSRIYRRAYVAFQLRDLSNETPLSTVARRYQVPRGAVQTLAQTCHGFAAGMVKFCHRMGWGMLAVVFEHMRDRLHAGAREDLLEMTKVALVKSWTARLLWENGFHSVRALAEADSKDLVPVLMMVRPRTSRGDEKHEEGGERYAAKILNKAEVIVRSANKLWELQMRGEIEE